MTFRDMRKRAGFTQQALATAAGVDQVTISQLELGKVRDPRYSTIRALARALDTTEGAVAKAIERTEAA